MVTKVNNGYAFVGLPFELYAFTLAELILQVKFVYGIDLLTQLN